VVLMPQTNDREDLHQEIIPRFEAPNAADVAALSAKGPLSAADLVEVLRGQSVIARAETDGRLILFVNGIKEKHLARLLALYGIAFKRTAAAHHYIVDRRVDAARAARMRAAMQKSGRFSAQRFELQHQLQQDGKQLVWMQQLILEKLTGMLGPGYRYEVNATRAKIIGGDGETHAESYHPTAGHHAFEINVHDPALRTPLVTLLNQWHQVFDRRNDGRLFTVAIDDD